MKKGCLFLLLSIMVMMLFFFPCDAKAVPAQNDVNIYLNGEKQQLSIIMSNDRIYVSLREFCNFFGTSIYYEHSDKTICVYASDGDYIFKLGAAEVLFNGDPYKMLEAPPIVSNDRTYLPLRYIAELFKMQVHWDAAASAVYISYDEIQVLDGVLIAYKGSAEKLDLSQRSDIIAIGDSVFWGTDLQEIILPPALECIGFGAFYATDISYIEIPDSVNEIGGMAFANCISLSYVKLPKNLSVLSPQLLTSTVIKELLLPPDLVRIENNIFKEHALAPKTTIERIIIPASVTTIHEDAFAFCDNFSIAGIAGSYVEEYAAAKGISFVPVTADDLAAFYY